MLFNMQRKRVAMLLWLAILSSVEQTQGCAGKDDANTFGADALNANRFFHIAPGSIAPSVTRIDWE